MPNIMQFLTRRESSHVAQTAGQMRIAVARPGTEFSADAQKYALLRQAVEVQRQLIPLQYEHGFKAKMQFDSLKLQLVQIDWMPALMWYIDQGHLPEFKRLLDTLDRYGAGNFELMASLKKVSTSYQKWNADTHGYSPEQIEAHTRHYILFAALDKLAKEGFPMQTQTQSPTPVQ